MQLCLAGPQVYGDAWWDMRQETRADSRLGRTRDFIFPLVLIPGLCAERLGGPHLRQAPHCEESHQVPGTGSSGQQRCAGAFGKGGQWGGGAWVALTGPLEPATHQATSAPTLSLQDGEQTGAGSHSSPGASPVPSSFLLSLDSRLLLHGVFRASASGSVLPSRFQALSAFGSAHWPLSPRLPRVLRMSPFLFPPVQFTWLAIGDGGGVALCFCVF